MGIVYANMAQQPKFAPRRISSKRPDCPHAGADADCQDVLLQGLLTGKGRVYRDDFAAQDDAAAQGVTALETAHAETGVGALLEALRRQHVECRPRCSGASLAVPVREVLHTPMVAMRLAHQLLQLAEDKTPFLLCLHDLGEGDEACAMFHDFCLMLASVLETGGRIPVPPALMLPSAALGAEAYIDLAAPLGAGDRYLALDDAMLLHTSSNALQQWRSLWQAQGSGKGPWPVYEPRVRSCCPLHSDEPAPALLPGDGLCVPAGSAWLPLRLPLPAFADARGSIDWSALRRAVTQSLQAADSLLDLLDWPTAAERNDAWLNRRLAIVVDGLGTLVARRGQEAARLEVLRALDRDLARLVLMLHSESRRLARKLGPTPSLLQTDPVDAWPAGELRSGWSRQWQQALYRSGTRHRNLVALSPYALLDDAEIAAAGCQDLLPVMRHAESVCFRGDTEYFRGFEEFRAFHCRSWAVLRAARYSRPIAMPA